MAMNSIAGATQTAKAAPELDRQLRGIRQRAESAADRLDAMLDRFASQPKSVGDSIPPEPSPTYENTLARIENTMNRLHAVIDSLEARL